MPNLNLKKDDPSFHYDISCSMIIVKSDINSLIGHLRLFIFDDFYRFLPSSFPISTVLVLKSLLVVCFRIY